MRVAYKESFPNEKAATPLCGGLGATPPLSDGNCVSNFLAIEKAATPLCGGLGAAPPLSDGNCVSNFLAIKNSQCRHTTLTLVYHIFWMLAISINGIMQRRPRQTIRPPFLPL